jgi:hypothetical protein
MLEEFTAEVQAECGEVGVGEREWVLEEGLEEWGEWGEG